MGGGGRPPRDDPFAELEQATRGGAPSGDPFADLDAFAGGPAPARPTLALPTLERPARAGRDALALQEWTPPRAPVAPPVGFLEGTDSPHRAEFLSAVDRLPRANSALDAEAPPPLVSDETYRRRHVSDLRAGFESGARGTYDLFLGAPLRAVGAPTSLAARAGRSIQDYTAEATRDYDLPRRGFLADLGQGLSSTLPTLAAATVAGPAGAAAAGLAMGVGDFQQNSEQRGDTGPHPEHLLGAIPYSALEMVFPTHLLARLGGEAVVGEAVRRGLAGMLGRAAKTAALSALENGSTEALQSLLTTYGTAYPNAIDEDTWAALKQAGAEGLAGAATGGLLGAGGSIAVDLQGEAEQRIAAEMRRRQQARRRPTQEPHVEDAGAQQLAALQLAGVAVDPVDITEPVTGDWAPAVAIISQLQAEGKPVTVEPTDDGQVTLHPAPLALPPGPPVVEEAVAPETEVAPEAAADALPPINPDSRYADEDQPEALYEAAKQKIAGHDARARAIDEQLTTDTGRPLSPKRRAALLREKASEEHLRDATLEEVASAWDQDTADRLRAELEVPAAEAADPADDALAELEAIPVEAKATRGQSEAGRQAQAAEEMARAHLLTLADQPGTLTPEGVNAAIDAYSTVEHAAALAHHDELLAAAEAAGDTARAKQLRKDRRTAPPDRSDAEEEHRSEEEGILAELTPAERQDYLATRLRWAAGDVRWDDELARPFDYGKLAAARRVGRELEAAGITPEEVLDTWHRVYPKSGGAMGKALTFYPERGGELSYGTGSGMFGAGEDLPGEPYVEALTARLEAQAGLPEPPAHDQRFSQDEGISRAIENLVLYHGTRFSHPLAWIGLWRERTGGVSDAQLQQLVERDVDPVGAASIGLTGPGRPTLNGHWVTRKGKDPRFEVTFRDYEQPWADKEPVVASLTIPQVMQRLRTLLQIPYPEGMGPTIAVPPEGAAPAKAKPAKPAKQATAKAAPAAPAVEHETAYMDAERALRDWANRPEHAGSLEASFAHSVATAITDAGSVEAGIQAVAEEDRDLARTLLAKAMKVSKGGKVTPRPEPAVAERLYHPDGRSVILTKSARAGGKYQATYVWRDDDPSGHRVDGDLEALRRSVQAEGYDLTAKPRDIEELPPAERERQEEVFNRLSELDDWRRNGDDDLTPEALAEERALLAEQRAALAPKPVAPEKQETPERVTEAAIQFTHKGKEYVFAGVNHADALEAAQGELHGLTSFSGLTYGWRTDRRPFVDREEGMRLARAAKQLADPATENTHLAVEDLAAPAAEPTPAPAPVEAPPEGFAVGDDVTLRGEPYTVAGGQGDKLVLERGPIYVGAQATRIVVDPRRVERAPVPATTIQEAPKPEDTDARPVRGDVPGDAESAAPAAVPEPAGERPAADARRAAGGSGDGAVRDDARGPAEGGARPARVSGEPAAPAGAGESGAGSGGRGAAEPAGRSAGSVPAHNLRLSVDDRIGEGGPAQKLRDNLAAITLLKQIEAEARPATVDEQQTLARYVGWGGLSGAFAEGHKEYSADLKDLLTDEEYRAARASTTNAHYTSPQVIAGLYAALRHLGVAGVRALEPSMGVGHFLGFVPEGVVARWTGVELDSLTGRMARLLYPEADVRVQGFQDAKLPAGGFDLAIGNPPFGDFKVHDPAYNKLKLPIHNYFFAKALDLVRPGGVVAFVTSRYTLDAKDSSFRQYVAERADLLAAVRLPEGTFKQNAGTEVVTDLIILQRRAEGAPANGLTFRGLAPVGNGVQANEYYAAHPEMMLGAPALTRGMHREDEPSWIAPKGQDIQQAMTAALTQALPAGGYQPAAKTALEVAREAAPAIPAPQSLREGNLTVVDGRILQVENGELVPSRVPGTEREKVAQLLGVRDAVRQVFQTQVSGASESAIAAARATLNQVYDAFVKAHGAISKETRTTTTRTTKAGEPIVTVRYPNLRPVMTDPEWPSLLALEHYDEDSDRFHKTDIFRERIIAPPEKITSVSSPDLALPAVLAELGRVDLARIAELAGIPVTDVPGALRGLIYRDPATGAWQPADFYLSGNVRAKLLEAQAKAAEDPTYADNVAALEAVQPEDLPPSAIAVRLGTPWVPTTDVEQFVRDVFGGRASVSQFKAENLWRVEPDWQARGSAEATTTYGTDRVNGIELLEAALNGKTVEVTDPTPTPDKPNQRTRNVQATVAALEKQEALKARFQTWIWQDARRADRLVRFYNDHFNTIRLPTFNGAHLTLPGAAASIRGRPFALRPHQKDAIWRILQSGNTLLAHIVGAGKTFVMVAAGMEAKRLGLARKPLYAVPNHMLLQFAREFREMYPTASLLVATQEDFAKDRRKAFTAKMAGHNWDAVIMTQRSFESIAMSKAYQAQMIERELDELEDTIRAAKQEHADKKLIKQIEKAKARREARLEALLAAEKKDDLLSFEELGVDMLLVDEAHNFKNLNLVSQRQGMGMEGSERAWDLYLKTQYLDQQTPGRGVVFATGTPLTNSIGEMFTLQRFLQPRLLAELGLTHFDSWLSQFAEEVTGAELTPEGKGTRLKTRIAKFVNMGELAQAFRLVTDVQMDPDALGLKRPTLLGGKMEDVAVPMSAQGKAHLEHLVARAELVRAKKVEPDEDNLLKITTEGRWAALDLRLVGGYQPDGGKLDQAAAKIAAYYEAAVGVRGAQLVFSDTGVNPTTIGVPGFSAYRYLRDRLIAAGIPAHEIAFIQDADTDEKKAKLFAKVRAGQVRVLLGSREKMGAGTNVQDRLVALHQLDVPWRPSDVEQSNGRILRQGNQLFDAGKIPGVRIVAYVTEGSFDAYIWQGIERKARFIIQALTADASTRTMEDIDGVVLTAAEMKGIASGNPLVMEQAKVDAEVQRLTRLQAAHNDEVYRSRAEVARLPQRIEGFARRVESLTADLARRQDTSGEHFALELGGTTYTVRKEAAAALHAAVSAFYEQGVSANWQGLGDRVLGHFAGFTLALTGARGIDGRVTVAFELIGQERYRRETSVLNDPPGAMLAQVEHIPGRFERDLAETQAALAQQRARLAKLETAQAAPFEKAEQLAKATARQAEIARELAKAGEAAPPGGTESAEAWAQVKRGELEDVTEPGVLEQTFPPVPPAGDGEARHAGPFIPLRPMLRAVFGEWLNAGTPPPGGPRVLAEPLPTKVGAFEQLLIPPSRVAQQLAHSAKPSVVAIGRTLEDLVDKGRTAQLAYRRAINEFQGRVQQLTEGLSAGEQAQLVELADTFEREADLPKVVSPTLRQRFALWRRWAREDWRQLGHNDYRMLTNRQSQADVRQALTLFPDGDPPPDYANVPLNQDAIAQALRRAQRRGLFAHRTLPTDAAGWRTLAADLKAARVRAPRPRFLTSPDLQRIVDMIQGRGGIMAYFPHVFQGEWVVEAGADTARFVDRHEAIRYARTLLETGKWTTDLEVRRDAFVPYDGLFVTRAHYDRMKRAIEAALDAPSFVVGKAMGVEGKIRVRPRKRRFAHAQKREVNLQTFDRDLGKAASIYYYRLARKLAFDPFRKEAVDLAETLPSDGGWRDYGLDYVAGVEGVPHAWVERVNATLEAATGGRLKPFALQRATTTWQMAMSYWHLGYSPVSALVNLTQLAINVLPRLGERGSHWLYEGLKAYAQAGPEAKRVLDRLGIELQHPKYLTGEFIPSWLRVRQDAWYMPLALFDKTENINRGGAALARYLQARAQGLSQAAAEKAAEHFVYDTNFDYSLADSATVFRDPVGRAFLQFKNFAINQAMFAYDLLRYGTPKQRATFTASLLAFGGLNVLARATPLFLLNWLLGLTGWWDDDRGEAITPWEALWDAVGDVRDSRLLSSVKYGVLAFFGAELSERVGFAGPREFSGVDQLVPSGKAADLSQALHGDTPAERHAALQRLLPVAIARISKALATAQDGVVRDRYGRVQEGKATALDVAAQALGVRTVPQAEQAEASRRQAADLAAYRQQRADFLDRMATAAGAQDWATYDRLQAEALQKGIHISAKSVKESLDRRETPAKGRRYQALPKDLKATTPPPPVEERAPVPPRR